MKKCYIHNLIFISFAFFFLFFSLFFYPFSIKYLSKNVYKVLYLLSLLFVIMTVLLGLLSKMYIDLRIFRKKEILIFLIFYFLYFWSVLLNSLILFYFVPEYEIKPIIFFILNNLLFIFFILFLTWQQFVTLMKLYVNIVFALSVFGILMIILIITGKLDVISYIYVDITKHGFDSGIREFYGLGYGWMHIKIGEKVFPRLQSFSTEAGNFAYALLVSILWTLNQKKSISILFKLIVMFFSLVLTLSIGALLILLILFILYLLREILQRNYKFIFINAIFIVFCILIFRLVIFNYPELYYALLKYINTKLTSSQIGISSMEIRINAIYNVLHYFVGNNILYGLGVDLYKIIKWQISNGWLETFAKAGPIFFIAYIFSFLFLLIIALYNILFSKDKYILTSSFIIIVMIFMAFFRSGMDSTFWHLWLIGFFIKIYVYHKNDGLAK